MSDNQDAEASQHGNEEKWSAADASEHCSPFDNAVQKSLRDGMLRILWIRYDMPRSAKVGSQWMMAVARPSTMSSMAVVLTKLTARRRPSSAALE